jgi:hypothetical protein
VKFVFDPRKNVLNKDKHGIDFIEAQAVFADTDAFEFDANPVFGEARRAVVGHWRGKLWTVIYTLRDEDIRIISARRARKGEADGYQKIQTRSHHSR